MLFTIDELQRDELKISRPTIHRLIRDGSLDAVKIGRRTLITEQSVARFLRARRAAAIRERRAS